jgi:hypothetical protein
VKKIVTRHNGLPAYVGALPRRRQSHFDTARKIAAMKAEHDALSDALGEQREVGITKGTVWAVLLFACLLAWVAVFVGLGIV